MTPAAAVRQQDVKAQDRRDVLASRLAKQSRPSGPPSGGPGGPKAGPGTRGDGHVSPPPRPHPRYYDRPDLIRHDYRRTYSYYDHSWRLHHRVVWPHYYYPVYYSFGPHRVFRHVYPYYHRKYVFVSLGGWWPWDYSYVRYYWYGWHPYEWYGYFPIAQEVAADNYNYYTYNYYMNADGTYTSGTSQTVVPSEAPPVDRSTWADVREKLDEQGTEPAPATLADTRFEEGVKSFEAGRYGEAAGEFEQAMRSSPDDMILPFACAQALFANGRYTESAEILRTALSRVSPEKEGVFYPRGLYADDDILFAQIEDLVEKLDQFAYDGDMQLLLGYHLLGVGETGYAREPLEIAKQDLKNAESAKTLLRLLDRIESEASKKKDTVTSAAVATSEVATAGPVEMKLVVPAEPNAATPAAPVQPVETPNSPAGIVPQAQPQETPAGDKTDVPAGTVVDPASGNKASGQAPQSSGAVGSALADLPAGLIRGVGRYLRADWGIFAGIVLAAWGAVYLQWRGLGCHRV